MEINKANMCAACVSLFVTCMLELAGVLQSPVNPQPPVWLQVVTGTDRFYFGLVGFMQPEPPPASASTGRASTWLSLAALLVEADRRVALPFQAR